MNCVNKEAFLGWYRAVARSPESEAAVLNRLYNEYCRTRVKEFVLSEKETVSGREERYPFNIEILGCCGASTTYIYF